MRSCHSIRRGRARVERATFNGASSLPSGVPRHVDGRIRVTTTSCRRQVSHRIDPWADLAASSAAQRRVTSARYSRRGMAPAPKPNLPDGIARAALAEGQMLVGDVDGEDVLLARHGDEIFAIGAACTHYHGALAQGLMVGDTVRCPLTTPASVFAPARCCAIPRSTQWIAGGSSVAVTGLSCARSSPAAAPPPQHATTAPYNRS